MSSTIDDGRPTRSIGLRSGPPWLRRRWALLLGIPIITVLAAVAFGVGRSQSYTAQSLVVVSSGASTEGPGNANEAITLARTYSEVIPQDTAVLQFVSNKTGLPPSEVKSRILINVRSDTSLLEMNFSDANPKTAVAGATALAQALTPLSVTPTVPTGTVQLVQLPVGNSSGPTSVTKVVLAGFIVGAVLAALVVVLIERIDDRLDDVTDAESILHSPVSSLDALEEDALMSRTSLVRHLAWLTSANEVWLVPLGDTSSAELALVADRISADITAKDAVLRVGLDHDRTKPDHTGAVVGVVAFGTTSRSVKRTVNVLAGLGIAPRWGIGFSRPLTEATPAVRDAYSAAPRSSARVTGEPGVTGEPASSVARPAVRPAPTRPRRPANKPPGNGSSTRLGHPGPTPSSYRATTEPTTSARGPESNGSDTPARQGDEPSAGTYAASD
jgi:capsular polysaccharide biosynthesis protein